MEERLERVLDDARRRSFVGRAEVIDRFLAAVRGEGLVRVLFVHGPGGTGKSELVARCSQLALDEGRAVITCDVGETGWDRALLADLGLRADSGPSVVLVDDYEPTDEVDAWVRTSWIPRLSTSTVVVVAARAAPHRAWVSDLGLRSVVSVHHLGALGDDDAAILLGHSGVAPDVVPALVRLGAGHPLALVLLARAAPDAPAPRGLSDLVAVAESLQPVVIGDVPGPRHQRALEMCAVVRWLDEALLAAEVGGDIDAVWAWLATRSFVTCDERGAQMSFLAREVVEALLVHRSPRTHRGLLDRVRAWSMQRVAAASGAEQITGGCELLWIHRREVAVGDAVAEVLGHRDTRILPGRPLDVALVARSLELDGDREESRLLRGWTAASTNGVLVLRDGDDLLAATVVIRLPFLPDPGVGAADEVVTAIERCVATSAPLRDDEEISVLRFGHARDGEARRHLAVLVGVALLTEWIARRPAWGWAVVARGSPFDEMFDYMGFDHRLDLGPHTVAHGFDWRRLPFDRWVSLVTERTTSAESGPFDPTLLRPAVLSRPAFDAAVRQALRDVRSPGALARGPLMSSLIALDADGRPSEAALRTRLSDEVERLRAHHHTAELAQVIECTHLRGVRTQEAAAELLGLAFSTYRRRLNKAEAALASALWRVEVGRDD